MDHPARPRSSVTLSALSEALRRDEKLFHAAAHDKKAPCIMIGAMMSRMFPSLNRVREPGTVKARGAWSQSAVGTQ